MAFHCLLVTLLALVLTQPFVVAVRREMGIQQTGYAHALHLGQQQREIIHPLGPNRQSSFISSVYQNL